MISPTRQDSIKLLIHCNLHYFGGEFRALMPLLKELSGRGFEVTLAGPMSGQAQRFLRSSRTVHAILPLPIKETGEAGRRNTIVPVPNREVQRLLLNQTAHSPPDVILLSGYCPFGGFVHRLKQPIIYRVIGNPKWWLHPRGAAPIKAGDLIRRIGHSSSSVITVSDYLKRVFRKEGVDNVKTVHEACDTDLFRPDLPGRREFRKRHRLSEQDVALGVIAHFYWQKRHEVVLEALALLARDSVQVRCFFVGTSFNPGMRMQEDSLARKIKNLGLHGEIRFLGFRDDIPRVINGLDILLFPFLDEGFGMSLLEAMACEKPVVVNRSGAFPELVDHDREGLIVPPEDPGALAGSVRSLAVSPAKRAALGKNGRARVLRDFSFSKQGEAYARLLRGIARNRPSP